MSLSSELAFAIGAGVATFFSPCAYALLPGYVGVYLNASGGETQSIQHDSIRAIAAAAGVIGVFLIVITAVAAVGEPVRAVISQLEVITGIGLILFGILLLWGADVGWHTSLPKQRSGLIGFGIFGAVYAVAAIGCVAPLFFALTLRAIESGLVTTIAVLGAYGGTIAVLLFGTTVTIGLGYEITTKQFTRFSARATQIGGAILVFAGVVQLYLTL
ncbi:cytochrome C biosynthesis protein [Halorubraceae archaeon YAN]|nr:cytochrome C biosynthesis protein [Halorubraceae archaeon YAN]